MARGADRLEVEYLAASARMGDHDALEALARRFERRFLAYAHRLTGERDLAWEVAQDAWSDITRRIRSLDDTAAFLPWAYRILTRRAADAIRRRRRLRAGMAAFAAEPRDESAASDGMDATASAPSIASALERLPKEQQAAIALFYLEDMSVAEIAAALEIPVGTVKTRLMAARDRLRVAFGLSKEKTHEQT